MNSQDQQFLQMMIQMELCNQSYAQKLLEQQKKLKEQGYSLAIPQILLQYGLARRELIAQIEGCMKKSAPLHSQTLFEPQSPSPASPSLSIPLNTEVVQPSSRWLVCPYCHKKNLPSSVQCLYCQRKFLDSPGGIQHHSSPLLFPLGFLLGGLLLVILGVFFLSQVQLSTAQKKPSTMTKKRLTSIHSPTTKRSPKQDHKKNSLPPKFSLPTQIQPTSKPFIPKRGNLKEITEKTFSSFHKGLYYFQRKQYQTALPYYQEAFRGFKKINRKDGVGACLQAMGDIYKSQGRLSLALHHSEQALQIAKQFREKIPLATLQCALGALCRDLGQFQKARGYLQKAIQNYREIKNKKGLSVSWNELGRVYQGLEKYSLALDSFQKSQQLSKSLGRQGDLAAGLFNMGEVYFELNQYMKALKTYQDSLKIYQSLGEQDNIAKNLNQIGRVHQKLGKYQQVISDCREAVKIYRKLAMKKGIAIGLNNIGEAFLGLCKYEQGLRFFQDSLRISKSIGFRKGMVTIFQNLSVLHTRLGNYQLASRYQKNSLRVSQQSKNSKRGIGSLNNLANLDSLSGNFQQALKKYKKTLKYYRKIENQEGEAITLSNMGILYQKLGQFQKAIGCIEMSIQITQKLGLKEILAGSLNNLSGVYEILGKHQMALFYLQKNLKVFQELGRQDKVANTLRNLGSTYGALRNYPLAIQYIKRAFKIYQKLKQKREMIGSLATLGVIYQEMGKVEEALDYHKRALRLSLEFKTPEEMAQCFTNLGVLYKDCEKYQMAIPYLKKALVLYQKLGIQETMVNNLYHLGGAYFATGQYKLAISCFQSAVQKIESLRQNIQGKEKGFRREFFSSKARTYLHLVLAYLQTNQFEAAVAVVENLSAKYFVEQMGNRKKRRIWTAQDILGFQKTLEPSQAVLYLYCASFGYYGLLMTDAVVGGAFTGDGHIQKLFTRYFPEIRSLPQRTRGLKVRFKQRPTGSPALKIKRGRLEKLIRYYRYLLQKPGLSGRELRAFVDLGKKLYFILFENLEKILKGRRELLVIPGGILSYLPLEALIMADGRYLGEKYKISYVQSLRALKQIKKRKFSKREKNLIAFGGAVYQNILRSVQPISSKKDLRNLKVQVWRFLARSPGGSLREVYQKLNYIGWEPLPGTLEEVRRVQKIVPGAEVLSGQEVREEKVKALSRSGILRKYRILHFATHGVAISEFPQLSALVLSQFQKSGKEDGYLRMGEVARLKLQADFVNLSACETGLGKIYGGEGVVGLAQAFLIAGANGVSVSLWQVSDKSTEKFMIEFYRLVFQMGMGYKEAITEVKRRFIRGDFGEEYKAPYFWAPFVYYGQ